MRVFLFLCSIFEVFGLLYRQGMRNSALSFSTLLGASSSATSSKNPLGNVSQWRGSYDADIELYNSLISCKDPELAVQINSSLSILSDALRLYGPER